MPQINTTLPTHLIDELKMIAQKSQQSFSKMTCQIIELGIKVHQKQEDSEAQKRQARENMLIAKHSEYLLRLINLNAEILRKLYNEDSKYDAENTSALLNAVKENVKKYIDQHLKSDD